MRLALLLTCLELLKLQSNTTWGRSNTKQSCWAHIRNDGEDIRQVASTLPASVSFFIQQNNNFFIAGASGAWNIHVFFVWFWQACKYLLSSSEWQASVRSVKLRSATVCTGVFLFYTKRHLMSGNEFACSLGSSSAKIARVWTQKTRWKTRADIRPGVYWPLR